MTGLALYSSGHESINTEISLHHHKMFSDIQFFFFIFFFKVPDYLKCTCFPLEFRFPRSQGNSKSYLMLSSMPAATLPYPDLTPPFTLLRVRLTKSDRPLFACVPFLFYCLYLPPPQDSSLTPF